MTAPSAERRVLELLADRALAGLTPVEERELEQLIGRVADAELLSRDVELAAAAVALANLGPLVLPPTRLLENLEAESEDATSTSIEQRQEVATARMAALPADPAPAGVGDSTDTDRPPAPAFSGDGAGSDAPPQKPSLPPLAAGVLYEATVIAPLPVAAKPPAKSKWSGESTAILQTPPATPGGPPSGSMQAAPPSEPRLAAPPNTPFYQPNALGAPRPPPPTPAAGSRPPEPAPQIFGLPPPQARLEEERSEPGGQALAVLGWIIASIAIVVAVVTWFLRPRVVVVDAPEPSSTTAPSAASLEADRLRLLARPGTVHLEWTRTKDAAARHATGDVVWSPEDQRGYATFKSLARTDRRAGVYELWIFDKERDDRYPIDGAVFEVESENGDALVPIRPLVQVGAPKEFQVTIERPGGVVVSKRERIVLTAAKPGS